MRRLLALPCVALLVAASGCLFFGIAGGPSEYVLTATDVTGNLTGHATADLNEYERPVATRAARNGTAETVGWRALDDGSYVAANGTYYRVTVERTGARNVTVPTLAVVVANGSADARREELPEVDQRALAHAYKFTQARDEANASVRTPRFGYGYFYGVEDSRLLAANGTTVRAFDETLRVVAFDATHEADVYEYRTERVARNESAFRRVVATNLSLSAAEREVLASAIEDEYRVSAERVDAGNATAFRGLLAAADLPAPERYSTYGHSYVAYEGRVYRLELRYLSAE